MMRRRAVGRSLVRTAATTAVIAGTAGAVRHRQNEKYANQAAAQQQQYDAAYQQGQMDAAQQPMQPAPQAAPAGEDISTQLQQLAQMHNAGVLTDEEFAAAKAKLLGG